MSSLDNLKKNAVVVQQTITALKSELGTLDQEYKKILTEELREENAQLAAQVEQLKKQLVNLEVKNGVPQIPVHAKQVHADAPQPVCDMAAAKAPVQEDPKAKKEKKPKEGKPAAPNAELPVDIGRLDLRIAKIEEVQRHPDADSLYVLKINCGEPKPRTVCSGLVKYVPMEELANRTVVLLCNLKPVKMRGITSEAMVMCASSEKGVEVLSPPNGAQPGDLVHCEGFVRQPDAVMNPKKKIFETVAPDLHTDGSLKACYKGKPLLVPDKGAIVAQTLANVPVK